MNDKEQLLPLSSQNQQPPLLKPSRYRRHIVSKLTSTQSTHTLNPQLSKAVPLARSLNRTTHSPNLPPHSALKPCLSQCSSYAITRSSAGSSASLTSKLTDTSTVSNATSTRPVSDHQRMRSTGQVVTSSASQAARSHFTSRSSELSSSVRRNAGRTQTSSASTADSTTSVSQKAKPQFHFMRPVGSAQTMVTRRKEAEAQLPVRSKCTSKAAPSAKQPHKHKVQTLKAALGSRQALTSIVSGNARTRAGHGSDVPLWQRERLQAGDTLRRPNWPPRPLLSQRGSAVAAATLATSRFSRGPPVRTSMNNASTKCAADLGATNLQNCKRLDILPEQESGPEDGDEHCDDDPIPVALSQPVMEVRTRHHHVRRPKRPSLGDGWTKRAQYLLDMTARRKASILESSPSIPSSPATRSEDNDIDTSPFLLKKNETTTPVPMPSQPESKVEGPILPRVPQDSGTARRKSDGRDLISSLAKSESDLRNIHHIMSTFLKEHDCTDGSQMSRKVSPMTTRPSSSANRKYTAAKSTAVDAGSSRLHSASERRSATKLQWRPHTPASTHISTPIICLNLQTPPFNAASSRHLVLSSDPKAPIRKPVSRRVLLSGILCKSVATVESAIVELSEDPNCVLPIPPKFKHRFRTPLGDIGCVRASALFFAVKLSSPQVVSKLIDLGAVVNTLDDWNRNALHLSFLPRPSEIFQCAQQLRGIQRSTPQPGPPVIQENATLDAPPVATQDLSRRSSLVTPRIVSHPLLDICPEETLIGRDDADIAHTQDSTPDCYDSLESLPSKQAEFLCKLTFTDDEDALSRIIELLCLRGCDIEARDIWGRTPIDYAKEWLALLSKSPNSTVVSGARAAALTLLAFEDRLRLKLLAPLTTSLSIRAYRPYRFIQIILPSDAKPADIVQFTPHVPRTCYNGADATIERSRRRSGNSCVSLDTRVRSIAEGCSVGKNASLRRGMYRASVKQSDSVVGLQRRKSKAERPIKSTNAQEFNLKEFVDLVHKRSFSHPGLLGIWEFLGAKFQVEARAD